MEILTKSPFFFCKFFQSVFIDTKKGLYYTNDYNIWYWAEFGHNIM